MKEWIDDQAGSIMKFSAPILSAARIENLGRVDSDMFIVQTPVHLKPSEKAALQKLIASGKPVMLCGSPANGIDRDFLRLAGMSTPDKAPGLEKTMGIIASINHPLAENSPHAFALYQPHTNNILKKDAKAEVIYTVSNSPALIRKDNLSIWDAPELLLYTSERRPPSSFPTDVLLGSAVPYALAARLVNDDLAKAGRLSARSPDMLLPVWCGSWTNKSGEVTILLGDIEEGLEHAGKDQSSIEITLPPPYGKRSLMREKWAGNTYVLSDNTIRYYLKRGESRLLEIKALKDNN
jgi:hypothetical protein